MTGPLLSPLYACARFFFFLQNTFSGGKPAFWIGLTDLATRGQWVWADTGTAASYLKWGHEQPGGGNEHCVTMGDEADVHYLWHDFQCTFLQYFICEIPRLLD